MSKPVLDWLTATLETATQFSCAEVITMGGVANGVRKVTWSLWFRYWTPYRNAAKAEGVAANKQNAAINTLIMVFMCGSGCGLDCQSGSFHLLERAHGSPAHVAAKVRIAVRV